MPLRSSSCIPFFEINCEQRVVLCGAHMATSYYSCCTVTAVAAPAAIATRSAFVLGSIILSQDAAAIYYSCTLRTAVCPKALTYALLRCSECSTCEGDIWSNLPVQLQQFCCLTARVVPLCTDSAGLRRRVSTNNGQLASSPVRHIGRTSVV